MVGGHCFVGHKLRISKELLVSVSYEYEVDLRFVVATVEGDWVHERLQNFVVVILKC